MSKLVLVNYRVSEAEEREVRRKIELIRAMLARCARLQQELKALEPVAGENWGDTLARYQKFVDKNQWREFIGDYNRLYDELPAVERQLETAVSEAKAKRLRLELTAATLMATDTTAAERAELSSIASNAASLYAGRFADAKEKVDKLLRRHLDTGLGAAEHQMTEDQMTLARELLAAMPASGNSQAAEGGFGEPPQMPFNHDNYAPRPRKAGRIEKLTGILSQIDPALAPVEDLLARLRQLAAGQSGEHALLLDSIELEAQERLAAARRRCELQAIVDDGMAWLSPFQSLSAEQLRERLHAALAAADFAAARATADEARAWAEAEGKRQDAERVRAVLLRELREFGYEVNLQGPAWDEGSRITIQKPSEPNYDIQLGAMPGGAVQSKVRAYDHPGRSAGMNRRDVEVEQSWCEDLARLNQALAGCGVTAEITHVEGPGSSEQKPLPARTGRHLEIEKLTEKQLARKS
jgi:hypothetical protein